MGATDRIVRHLNLRAQSEADVRHTVRKLEDALRCASLPDAGARVLLIRRLDLGPIGQDASPRTLSRLIEQRVAATGGTWLHASEAGAPHARFVYFRDALEARSMLALRLAKAVPCTAWFWPLAVPEFKPALDASSNLRRIALALADLPEAPAALPAWVAQLTAAGVASAIARILTPADAVLLLSAAHVPLDPMRAAATYTTPSALAMGTAPVSETPLRSDASPQHSVSRHSAVAPRAADTPGPDLPAWWQALASAGERGVRAVSVASPLPHPHAQATQTAVADAYDTPPAAAGGMLAPPGATPASASASAIADRVGIAHATFTHFGGLLFMLTVLQRLDFSAWAEQHLPQGAASHLARQILTLTLQRLQAPSDDPAWQLASTASDDPADFVCAQGPACWGDPVLAAPRGIVALDLMAMAIHPQPAATLARLWLLACRRWLRRRAHIGVASLIKRPAALVLNATHVEVYFHLNATDMRVRRAGLDLDPGWVGWFGRVIGYHYSETLASVVTPQAAAPNHGR